MRGKEEGEKAGLKLSIQKTKIMASSLITSWQLDGETMETVTDFIFLGSKITVGDDCSHEIKRHLLHGRKAMTNLDSILKSRDITLQTKVRRVNSMVFPLVMSWVLKKVGFELWCWRTLLRVPGNPKGSQSWLFIERTDAEAEAPILWPSQKNWLIGKDHDAGKDWRQEEKGTIEDEIVGWYQWLDGRVWSYSGSWWWTGKPGVLQSMGKQRVGHNWATELKHS